MYFFFYLKLGLSVPIYFLVLIVMNLSAEETGNYGIRAALFAMAAAFLLFLTMLPDDRPLLNTAIKLFSIVVTFLAGWYWLLDASEGNPIPYLSIISPMVVGFGGVIFLSHMVMAAQQFSEDQKREHGKYTFISFVTMLIAMALFCILPVAFLIWHSSAFPST